MSLSVKPDLKNPYHFLAFGFGSGLAPKAPGTAGTLVAIIPFYFISQLSLEIYSLILVGSILAGILICNKTSEDLGVHDHGGIVWDEFCGFWLTMVAVPVSLLTVVVGFILFRFFDIIKPWPINWLDKNIKGGAGIMIDDLIAGLYAWIILQSLLYFQV